MINKLVVGFVATTLVAGSVFAQSHVSVRESAPEARGSRESRESRERRGVEESRGGVSRESLEAIRRGARNQGAGSEVRRSTEVTERATESREARDQAVGREADRALEAREAAPAAEQSVAAPRARRARTARTATVASEITAPGTVGREALALRGMTRDFGAEKGQEVITAITSVSAEHYPVVRRFAADLGRKVRTQGFDVETAVQLIKDNAASPAKLAGQLVLGEGSSRACLRMANDAIKNLGEFIRGGETEGRDPATYLEGMARKAAAKFEQSQDEGAARICALFAQNCFKTADALMAACRSRAAAH